MGQHLSILGARLPDAVIPSDSLNHTSMIEGIRHTRCQKVIWKHNDPEDLDRKLAALPASAVKIVAFGSVCSMDRDISPMTEIVEVAEKHGDDLSRRGARGRALWPVRRGRARATGSRG